MVLVRALAAAGQIRGCEHSSHPVDFRIAGTFTGNLAKLTGYTPKPKSPLTKRKPICYCSSVRIYAREADMKFTTFLTPHKTGPVDGFAREWSALL
jgi:hypothetical protein